MIVVYIIIGLVLGLIFSFVFSFLRFPLKEIKRLNSSYLKEGKKLGEWKHASDFVDHDYKEIVKPNCDTLYSYAFIDLSKSSFQLEFPEIKGYFSFAFLGKNTDVLGYITNRNYNGVRSFNLTARDKENSIRLETDVCWVIARFGTEENGGVRGVNRIQKELKLTAVNE